MKRVLTAVVLIPVVLLLVFRAPLWLFALAVAGIIIVALHEYLGLAEASGYKPFHGLTYVVALVPTVVSFALILRSFEHSSKLTFYSLGSDIVRQQLEILVLLPIIFGIPVVFRKDLRGGLASAACSAFGVLYVGISLVLLITLRSNVFQVTLVVFILFSVWAGDIAAYYVGRTLGRHKLAPVVSPNKSWEGAVASVIASILVAIAVFHFNPQIERWFSFDSTTFYIPLARVPWVHVIALGITTNIAAQFGDLFESGLKRGAGVKDSGTLLPGHGGMLDRIDALLFAIPAVWYYANLTGLLLPRLHFP
jgi:phosphatidate cytidylyltransferase